MTKENKKLIPGIIKRHADGFGFLIPDDLEHADVYIPKHFMIGIMTNDRVLAEVFKSRGEDRFHGEIIKIMSRGTKKLVGRIKQLNDLWFLIPDESKAWGHDLKIKSEDALNAKSGDLVQVEILNYPGEGTPFAGKVVEVIGDAEDPLNDVMRVLRTQNVPVEFSVKTLSEVAGLKEDPVSSDWKTRTDLMSIPLITIDGATAKDFDDAVFTGTTTRGFHLIVAIADVSHYVKPGTSLDSDAYDRGTSVYFPNFVVPMLPEILSNGLCSLKPNVPRLCLVADMQFDFHGELLESAFYEAVMKSQARVTYGEAQEIIDGTDIEKFKHVKENILRCSDLAKVLMIRRFREGSLDLNISQTELEIDASGNPVDVQKSERLFAHRLIEELMLSANVAVAKFLAQKEKGAIFRIHDEPSPDAIKLLELYLHNLGSKIRLSGPGKLQKKLSKALEHFADHAEGQIINILTLRSLSQAKYSSNNIGHFGLGFDCYTHFTSPIRRYPDLIVHRLVKHFVVSQGGYRMPEIDDLTTAGNILSATEQRAVKCERQFMSIKKARFIERHVGKEFVGMISAIARFGAFVLLREFDIDGLVKLENLGEDRWNYDEENLLLMGEHSKKVFKLGQAVKILVTSADVELGQINFDLHPDFKVVRKSKGPGKGESSQRDGDRGNGRRKGKSREHSRETARPSSRRNEDTSAKSKRKDFDHKNQTKDGRKESFRDKDRSRGQDQQKPLSKVASSKPLTAAPPQGPAKRVFDKKETVASQGSVEAPAKKPNRLLEVLARFKRKSKEGSESENNRNRKDSRQNTKKRGKTKNDSRGIR
jgi:ribonuclease R